MLSVRRAQLEDRSRILEISSQIWDGDDYVPELLDGWFSDDEGELAVATRNDHVIAFAHRTWLSSGIAWFEGIRTDPAWEGHGAAKAITKYFIDGAKTSGASRINLSTHIDNQASIHIIESYGFSCTATFSYAERPAKADAPQVGSAAGDIRELSSPEVLAFVDTSQFLSLAQRRFPRRWRFFPFDHNPDEALAQLRYRIGAFEESVLKAALCIRQYPDHSGQITINFLDGEMPAMRSLLHHALKHYTGKGVEIMIPIHAGQHARALEILRETGFTSWSDFKPDVFAYELML